MTSTLTAERLRELLHYDPATGIFTRLVKARSAACGAVAGTAHNRGYLVVRLDGKKYLMHRLACVYITGHFPAHGMDHINGIKDDNRWNNLREANQSENSQNRRLRKDSTTGVTGVSFKKEVRLWVAVIFIEGVSKHLGYFASLEEAAKARAKAQRKYHPFCTAVIETAQEGVARE